LSGVIIAGTRATVEESFNITTESLGTENVMVDGPGFLLMTIESAGIEKDGETADTVPLTIKESAGTERDADMTDAIYVIAPGKVGSGMVSVIAMASGFLVTVIESAGSVKVMDDGPTPSFLTITVSLGMDTVMVVTDDLCIERRTSSGREDVRVAASGVNLSIILSAGTEEVMLAAVDFLVNFGESLGSDGDMLTGAVAVHVTGPEAPIVMVAEHTAIWAVSV